MIWLIRLVQRIPVYYIYLSYFASTSRCSFLEENGIRMGFLSCFQTQITTIDPLLFFLLGQPHPWYCLHELEVTYVCHGTTNIRMTGVILPIHSRISRPIEVIDPLRKRRVRRGTNYHQLIHTRYKGGVLSVTCFAHMKYACILFIPHPTGGLRLIDSRLCSLLPISFNFSRSRGTYSASLTCCASFDLYGAVLTCSFFASFPLSPGRSVHSFLSAITHLWGECTNLYDPCHFNSERICQFIYLSASIQLEKVGLTDRSTSILNCIM